MHTVASAERETFNVAVHGKELLSYMLTVRTGTTSILSILKFFFFFCGNDFP